MRDAGIVAAFAAVVACLLLWRAIRCTPAGREDDSGFHYDNPNDPTNF